MQQGNFAIVGIRKSWKMFSKILGSRGPLLQILGYSTFWTGG